jgi:3-hydroxy-9,10-secoandrosta-1,3,5(10)-triene-9,17-dione monooxygenase reductase component
VPAKPATEGEKDEASGSPEQPGGPILWKLDGLDEGAGYDRSNHDPQRLGDREPTSQRVVDVTIHSEHPFLPPEGERNAVRRLRGRLTAPVTLWTAYDSTVPAGSVGLTVSSILIADGAPGRVLGLIDAESDLYQAMLRSNAVAVTVLAAQHRALADAFAGVAPAPGGVFRLAEWTSTQWGPVLADPLTWVGGRLAAEPREVGWGHLVEAVIEHVEFGDDGASPLAYRRGRYLT